MIQLLVGVCSAPFRRGYVAEVEDPLDVERDVMIALHEGEASSDVDLPREIDSNAILDLHALHVHWRFN